MVAVVVVVVVVVDVVVVVVVGVGVVVSALQFNICAFPFLTLRVNENIPSLTGPVPEHFLLQLPVPVHLARLVLRSKEQTHFFLPKVTFLNFPCDKYW